MQGRTDHWLLVTGDLAHQLKMCYNHQGALLLSEVQLAGKRALSAEDFARGQRDFVSSVLGVDLWEHSWREVLDRS
jgi:hypothetical protein